MLKDSFGRIHDYLRISVTDKCNFSCAYCIPIKDCHFLPNDKIMTADEIFEISKIFNSLGVKKIRLTGGEPLLRNDIVSIIQKIKTLPIHELAITTNGYFLDRYIDDLKKLGVYSINVSLDTLNSIKFQNITQKDAFNKVYSNIQMLLENNYHPKINVVLVKDMNDDEIIQFINITQDLPVHIRFIEYMPFESNRWNFEKVVTLDELLNVLKKEKPELEKLSDAPNSTAKSYRIKGYKGTFAIISTVSHPFCNTCNRIRLTADGKLRNCLFAQTETDLLTPLRKGEDIRPLIFNNINSKFWKRGGLPDFHSSELNDKLSKRKMIEIGG